MTYPSTTTFSSAHSLVSTSVTAATSALWEVTPPLTARCGGAAVSLLSRLSNVTHQQNRCCPSCLEMMWGMFQKWTCCIFSLWVCMCAYGKSSILIECHVEKFFISAFSSYSVWCDICTLRRRIVYNKVKISALVNHWLVFPPSHSDWRFPTALHVLSRVLRCSYMLL